VKRIVTGEETWIHHDDPETKQQGMQWKHASSPIPRKFKVQAVAAKIMCTVFWDAEDVLLIGYMPHKVNVKGVYYADLLHKLRVAITQMRRGSWPRYRYSCMTMHLLTGHRLDKPLYLNVDLKKCAIHHILFVWQQEITICFQIERNISVVRDFWTMRNSNMRPIPG